MAKYLRKSLLRANDKNLLEVALMSGLPYASISSPDMLVCGVTFNQEPSTTHKYIYEERKWRKI